MYSFLVLLSTAVGAPTTVNLSTEGGVGKRFDGVGAISGGGATSKLLSAYKQQPLDDVCSIRRESEREKTLNTDGRWSSTVPTEHRIGFLSPGSSAIYVSLRCI